ncbi:ubiquinone biosynthesis O-methyltransferase, mitochondrial isoform X2 [Apodemus sylvaticus]|uniref:ubiquinone biosynthesis O-methyltransferase, mitochondrial isoform X2 n=1 Tax=Apodemus sylvaticus TaxID=10129 RepID=UPI002242DA83|nr:ubiquinone biosynthesis O-methyltransferase, mitochondrial isoform X2 [Apodemus sylvaticus]
MWRGGRLSSGGVRLLETLGFGCPSAVAEPPRIASWSGKRLTRNLQLKPWELGEHRIMCFRSYRMASSCLTRVKTYRDNLLKTSATHHPGKPLSGMKILDVGCGGGLLTEPLGRLGASVVGIDPVDEMIRIAQHHKSFDPVLDERVQYKVCSLEEIVNESTESFDAVVASEVLEHVSNLELFVQCCYQVLKPGGSLFITTINKTQLSYALGIVFAERIAGIVPKGTHMWEKFVSPEKLESILEPNGLSVETVAGMVYNPFSGFWHWSQNTSLNYAAHAVRSRAQEHQEPAESALKGEMEALHANASSSPSGHAAEI